MQFRHMILCAFLLFPTLAFSSITGKYKFKGTTPTGGEYKGTATIVQGKGNVYEARWLYPDGSFEVGTGVKKGDYISFVFASVIGTSFGTYGVIQYKINDHTLKGTYAIFAEPGTGHEIMKKIDKK